MDFTSIGIKGMSEAENLPDVPFMKIALVGDPSVGKSWCACTFPGEKIDFDFDGRKDSLKGKSQVHVKTYHDANPNTVTAMADFEQDLAAFKYAKSRGKQIPDVFIIDSVTYCKKGTEAELIRQNKSLGRVLRVGSTALNVGQGWDIYNGNRLYLEYVINELSALGTVIAIFHENYEKDESRSTPEKKVYTGQVTVSPQYLASVLSIFNDVWRLYIDYSGKRVLQTGISPEFVGKCTLKGLDPLKEEPYIDKLLAKHKAYLAANPSK